MIKMAQGGGATEGENQVKSPPICHLVKEVLLAEKLGVGDFAQLLLFEQVLLKKKIYYGNFHLGVCL